MALFAQKLFATYLAATEQLPQKPVSELTTTEYNSIIFGVVHGVILQEGLTEVSTCVSDAKSEATEVYTIYKDLLARSWMTGFQDLATLVEYLPGLMTDCTHMQDDIATLQSWATVFLTPADLPATIEANISSNILKLTHQLTAARSDWKNENYYQFGTDIGKMLTIVTQPLPADYILN